MVYHGSILQWVQTKDHISYNSLCVHPFIACLVTQWVTSPLPHVSVPSRRNFPKAPIVCTNLLCGHTMTFQNTQHTLGLAFKANSRSQISPQINSSWTKIHNKLTTQKHSKTMLTKWNNIQHIFRNVSSRTPTKKGLSSSKVSNINHWSINQWLILPPNT